MNSYSQCGQDLFVHNLMKGQSGTFLDLGCFLPFKINNTYLLELNGWTGISLDIKDYSKEWSARKNKFVQTDCLTEDYNVLLPQHYESKLIDYLTLDMEACGDRFKLLSKIMDTDYEFKIITIEHDSYLGSHFINQEKIPQRKLLESKGYKLICSDIAQIHAPFSYFEDWWINPKYIDESDYSKWISSTTTCGNIFKKLGIPYTIDPVSLK
jgi:hypothetical protein